VNLGAWVTALPRFEESLTSRSTVFTIGRDNSVQGYRRVEVTQQEIVQDKLSIANYGNRLMRLFNSGTTCFAPGPFAFSSVVA
jgi:hypothetical protein